MPESQRSSAIQYPGGVVAIDTLQDREWMAASYLLEDADEAAFIETGVNSSVPRLLGVLEERGWRRRDVRYVIVTHVHLDHAGGAGRLMQVLPSAELLVHPRGTRHMIDPSKLEASVRTVYGDAYFDATYGTLQAVDARRVREMGDGEQVRLGRRTLLFRDSPGHARHHFCIWDAQTRGWFSGDTFGVSYRELDTASGPFILPTTTPVQFDPPVLKESIGMLMGFRPEWMYLTHYGRVGDLERLAGDMLASIDVLVEMAERHRDSRTRTADIEADMMRWLKKAAREHGVTMDDKALEDILEGDVKLNTQGIEFWLDHR